MQGVYLFPNFANESAVSVPLGYLYGNRTFRGEERNRALGANQSRTAQHKTVGYLLFDLFLLAKHAQTHEQMGGLVALECCESE